VEDGTIGDDVESGGDDGLEHLSSKLNWIQKIISSARMGGISGPLVRVVVITRIQICAIMLIAITIALILMVCCCSMSLFLHS
jgi:hypothetical protein